MVRFVRGFTLVEVVTLFLVSAIPAALAAPARIDRSRARRRSRGAGAAVRQRGASLTELMIALAVGAILLAGTLELFGGHRQDERDLARAARLDGELRAAMDTIARDLRRASYWGDAASGARRPNGPQRPANPFLAVDTGTPGEVTYRYDVDSDGVLGAGETFRIRHDAGHGTIELLRLDRDGSVSGRTPITDGRVTVVSALGFTRAESGFATTCPNPDAGVAAPTPPVIRAREVTVTLTGRLRADPAAARTLTESVRLRNDAIEGSCPS